MLHGELCRLTLQAIREVRRGGRGAEGKDRDHKQTDEQRGVSPDPGTKPRFLVLVVGEKLLVPYRFLVVARVHCPKLPEAGERYRYVFTADHPEMPGECEPCTSLPVRGWCVRTRQGMLLPLLGNIRTIDDD